MGGRGELYLLVSLNPGIIYMNQQEIKQYVMDTIRSGNKDRIKKVLDRYWEYVKEEKNKSDDKFVSIFKDLT